MAMYLDENRYSPRTRESYLRMLEFFFRYLSKKEPLEITEEEISSFLNVRAGAERFQRSFPRMK
jgi:site-specific recombinase XerD